MLVRSRLVRSASPGPDPMRGEELAASLKESQRIAEGRVPMRAPSLRARERSRFLSTDLPRNPENRCNRRCRVRSDRRLARARRVGRAARESRRSQTARELRVLRARCDPRGDRRAFLQRRGVRGRYGLRASARPRSRVARERFPFRALPRLLRSRGKPTSRTEPCRQRDRPVRRKARKNGKRATRAGILGQERPVQKVDTVLDSGSC